MTDVTSRLLGDELRALRVLKRGAKSGFTFVSERDAPFTLAKLIERAGVAAKIGFKVHMHTAKTIPPAVVASALRSSASRKTNTGLGHANPPPMLDRPGVIWRCKRPLQKYRRPRNRRLSSL